MLVRVVTFLRSWKQAICRCAGLLQASPSPCYSSDWMRSGLGRKVIRRRPELAPANASLRQNPKLIKRAHRRGKEFRQQQREWFTEA